jgi:predicted MFS family arabinose efflux permease
MKHHASQTAPSWQYLLVTGGLVVTLATGARQVFGLFLHPVAQDLGISLGSFGAIVATQNLVWGLTQPCAGLLADRFGAARVAALCGLIYAAGLAMAASATGPVMFAIGAGLFCGIGQAGTTYAVILAAISRATPAASRSVAVGLGTAAGSVGMFVLVPASGMGIAAFGWREAMAGLAVLMLLAPLCGLTLREKPVEAASASVRSVLNDALADRDFWLLNIGFATCGFQLAFLGTYLPAYLTDKGLAASAGAATLAAIGLANILGTWSAGYAGRFWPNANALAGAYVARGVLMVTFLTLPVSLPSAIAFGASIGLLWTGTVPLTSGLVARLWGRRHLGFLFGLVFVGHQVGAFAGAWTGGLLRDWTGGFGAGWALVAASSLSAALCHVLIRERPRAIALAEG